MMPRVVRRHPAYVAFGTLSLALAVGATLAVFQSAARQGPDLSAAWRLRRLSPAEALRAEQAVAHRAIACVHP